MAVYNIAGLDVSYDCAFDLLKSRSEKYLSEKSEAQIKLSLDEEYYKSRRELLPSTGDDVIEYMGIGSAFYKELLDYNGMLLHASCVAVNGEAYLFSAPSGTGKSTHTEKWLECFPQGVIVNDDKPALRKIDGRYFAFGTPFSGKNDISINKGYPVRGICFLDRGENRIEKIDPSRALKPLLNQTIRPADESKMDALCTIAEDIINSVPFYFMFCDVSCEAAKMAYKMMKSEGEAYENKA